MKKFSLFILTLTCLAAIGCSSPVKSSPKEPTSSSTPSTPSTGPRTVLISWAANNETALNASGGGYNLYYSHTSGFTVPGTATVINVPYVSGASAPTSVSMVLNPGTYYFKVAGYSSVKALGYISAQTSLVVP